MFGHPGQHPLLLGTSLFAEVIVMRNSFMIVELPFLTFVGSVYRFLFWSFRITYDASYHVLGVSGTDMMLVIGNISRPITAVRVPFIAIDNVQLFDPVISDHFFSFLVLQVL
jgi:hypothetical protein